MLATYPRSLYSVSSNGNGSISSSVLGMCGFNKKGLVHCVPSLEAVSRSTTQCANALLELIIIPNVAQEQRQLGAARSAEDGEPAHPSRHAPGTQQGEL